MPFIPNARVIYAAHPRDYPVPGETIVHEPEAEYIDLELVPLNGGVLLKTLFLSVDPYMRGKMRDPSIKSYSPAFELGRPMTGGAISRVLRSESIKLKAGDCVSGLTPWKAYNVMPAEALRLVQNPAKLPLSAFLGVAGMPGLTAFYGLRAYAKWRPGETCFVSTGAGAVGSIVCQLAKLSGLKVIASTGDDEKVQYLKRIGVDVAFNYKTEDTREQLRRHGPVDVYWDNVGGPTLDAALEFANAKGRFIMCGYASGYNAVEPYGVKHVVNILARSLSVNGFIVSDLVMQAGGLHAFQEEYTPLVGAGKILYQESRSIGLEKAGHALLEILRGQNQGKGIVVVSEE